MKRLELYEPERAYERLETWLADHGFFPGAPGAPDARVADLYLGYGLSAPIRRRYAPTPREPCSLPLLRCVVRSGNHSATHDNEGSFRIGVWEPTWSAGEYSGAVEDVREAIGRGDVYQVNLAQHLDAPFAGDPRAVAARLRNALPQPKDGPLADDAWRVMQGDGWAIVSASPELFLARRGRRVWTMPIKGTRPLGGALELRGSAKDAAEHVMIVDLERNDLSRVCEPGSIRWPELMAARSLAGVEHMVSTVEGTLRTGVGLAELLAATFPGGSITGAPKIAAVDLIAELEPVGRGASMGAVGRVYPNGDLELALTIRTFAIADDRIHLWVGGGVVWDSDPLVEVEESLAKAAPLLAALDAPLRSGGAARPARSRA